jgi:hypothetical protein
MKSFNVLIIISISTARIVAAIILIATTYAIAAVFILTNDCCCALSAVRHATVSIFRRSD